MTVDDTKLKHLYVEKVIHSFSQNVATLRNSPNDFWFSFTDQQGIVIANKPAENAKLSVHFQANPLKKKFSNAVAYAAFKIKASNNDAKLTAFHLSKGRRDERVDDQETADMVLSHISDATNALATKLYNNTKFDAVLTVPSKSPFNEISAKGLELERGSVEKKTFQELAQEFTEYQNGAALFADTILKGRDVRDTNKRYNVLANALMKIFPKLVEGQHKIAAQPVSIEVFAKAAVKEIDNSIDSTWAMEWFRSNRIWKNLSIAAKKKILIIDDNINSGETVEGLSEYILKANPEASIVWVIGVLC